MPRWPGFHTNTTRSSCVRMAHIASIIAPRSRTLHSAASRERQIDSMKSSTARLSLTTSTLSCAGSSERSTTERR
eukprot:scaffold85710_cov33-Phaeocystis_antarctica.AAC.3